MFVVSGTKPDWRCGIACARDCNGPGVDLTHGLQCSDGPAGVLWSLVRTLTGAGGLWPVPADNDEGPLWGGIVTVG
jgi:hypothetical protein